MFLRRIETIKAFAFSKIWHEHDYHYCYRTSPVLACLKQWSYNKTQLPNNQIRSTWCIATRGNVSKACILTVFETIWNCREHFRNNASKEYILTLRFGTADIISKTMSLKHACWRYLKYWELQRKKWKRYPLSMHCDGIWNDLELQRKKWKQGR